METLQLNKAVKLTVSPCCKAPVTDLRPMGYMKIECSACHAVLMRFFYEG